MSLMGMRRFFTKFGPFVYVPLVLAFAVGGFVGLGSYLFGDSTQAQSNEPPVASIGDMQVTAASLDQQLNEVMQQQGQMMGNPSPAERPRLRLMILDQYKQMQALAQAAKQAGITVSDAEIERARNEQCAAAPPDNLPAWIERKSHRPRNRCRLRQVRRQLFGACAEGRGA